MTICFCWRIIVFNMGNLTVVAYNKKRYVRFFWTKTFTPSFLLLLLLRLSYSFAFAIRSRFFLSTLLRPNAANESVLHNGSNTAPLLDAEWPYAHKFLSLPQSFPSALFFFFLFPSPSEKIYIPACKMIVIHTHPHIYFIRRPLSLYFFGLFFFSFFMSARAFKWPLHKIA